MSSPSSEVIDISSDESLVLDDSTTAISDSSRSIISDSDDDGGGVTLFSPPVLNKTTANKTLGIRLGCGPSNSQPKLHISSTFVKKSADKPVESITSNPIVKDAILVHEEKQQSVPKVPLKSSGMSQVSMGRVVSPEAPNTIKQNPTCTTSEDAIPLHKPTKPNGPKVPFGNLGISQVSVGRAVSSEAPRTVKYSPPLPLLVKKSSPPIERLGMGNVIIPAATIKPVAKMEEEEIFTVKETDEDTAERRERSDLAQKLLTVREQINQANKTISTLNLDTLPDKGLRLQLKLSNLKLEQRYLHKKYKELTEKIAPTQPATASGKDFDSLPVAQPYKRPGTIMVAESLTGDALTRLHTSLRDCPIESGKIDEGPNGLKVSLLPHQQRAMAWLLWRETQHPKGGILADDMGLGKTLTMIALVIRSKEIYQGNEENVNNSFHEDYDLPKGGTLVVCPASVLGQWEAEIKNRCERKKLSCFIYHGKERPANTARLARMDIVITTYNLVAREGDGPVQHMALDGLQPVRPQGMLFSVQWERVILDEAHQVRNPKTKMAKGVCGLISKYRWCLTGTPIHNKLLDLYSLIKFLKFTPFSTESVWKRCAENKSVMGKQRLSTIMKTIMLRRTKQELQLEGQLKCLPQKQVETIEVPLLPEENEVYQHMLKKSKTLMARFMMQRAEKKVETGEDPYAVQIAQRELESQGITMKNGFGRLGNDKEKVQTSHILLHLLRLRQICCHTALVKSKIDDEIIQNDNIDGDDDDDLQNLVANMNQLELDDEEEERKKLLDPNNPVYKQERVSSKLAAVLDMVLRIYKTDEKVVLVSQWTSMLDIVDFHLRQNGVHGAMFTGKLDARKRLDILNAFNQENYGPKVLLLSLTAGGTGINLIGGNHLVLMDIHWNPQLEAQAMDRVFRVGQKRDVKIYKFLCTDSVEQSIQLIQEKKLGIADGILNSKSKTKLDFEDLKSLFQMM